MNVMLILTTECCLEIVDLEDGDTVEWSVCAYSMAPTLEPTEYAVVVDAETTMSTALVGDDGMAAMGTEDDGDDYTWWWYLVLCIILLFGLGIAWICWRTKTYADGNWMNPQTHPDPHSARPRP